MIAAVVVAAFALVQEKCKKSNSKHMNELINKWNCKTWIN